MINSPLKPDPWPRSHYDLIEYYYARYDKQIASGEYQPFLYPWGTLGAVVVIIYLLIPHQNRPWLKKCRFLVFAWMLGFALYTLMYTRAKGMASSFGIGVISAWSVAWVSAILVCNDAQTDFQRIERLEGFFKGSPIAARDGNEVSKERDQDNEETGSSTAMDTRQVGTSSTYSKTAITKDMVQGHSSPTHRHGAFAWQPYPLTPFIERADWVLDIFCNFRGAGWNWRTTSIPPPPKAIQTQLHHNTTTTPPPKTSSRIHAGQVKLYTSRTDLLAANTRTFILGYLTLDLLKTVLMHDPYFWGLVDRAPPSYLPYAHSQTLTHIAHFTFSMLGVKTALQTIFALGPLVFTRLPLGARAEHWMYPETWGSYSIVLDKGLAGWWGAWWHQTFRFAFQEPSRRVMEVLGWDARGAVARAGGLLTAFGMSGVVHACGSYSSAGDTYPMRNPMTFFLVQAVGVGVEAALKSTGIGARVPRWCRRVGTFMYVHVWFYFTAHLLCDDFARGGIWLFEPVPVSVFRGLGFGADGRDGWWCWWGTVGEVVRWHRGKTWWTTGLAF